MANTGAEVVRLDAPDRDDYALANAAGMILSRAEAAQFHREMGTDLDRCIPEVRDQLREATQLPATDYLRAVRLRGQLRDRLDGAMGGVDVLAMPTCKVVAPPRPDADQYLLVLSENCIPWSFVDFPAISVPMGRSEGLPCGIQFFAAPGQDPLLLSTAYAYERLAPVPLEWTPPA
jgi:aspartyl-tRNA(Asn)/glutamyl-tRNA(Gln) amidotransferase subunit A